MVDYESGMIKIYVSKVMNKTILILLLLSSYLIVCSCSTPIEEYQAKNNDEKDIIDLLKRYTEIINKGNTEQILTLFHENGVYVTGRGNVALSREKMTEWKPEDWLYDGKRKFYNPEITLNGNEAKVMVHAKFGKYTTAIIFTLVKENDKWLIMQRL